MTNESRIQIDNAIDVDVNDDDLNLIKEIFGRVYVQRIHKNLSMYV